jgi:hypothetical protein
MTRDDGQDKTDKEADKKLAEKALSEQNRMPFFEEAPPIRYCPTEPTKD